MKNNIKFLTAGLFLITGVSYAQTGIGTTTPDASAVLDVSSTSKGLLFPRLTTTQRDGISNPAKGLVIFNTTANELQTNTGTPSSPIWTASGAGATGPQGPQGIQGATGATGPQGVAGSNGLSAYQVWLNAGNTGTEAQFLVSLVGATGPQGATGAQGPQGIAGATGATGPQGPIGLTGATGATGAQGPQGVAGATGPQGPAGSNATVTGTAPIAVNSGVVSLNDAGVSTAKIADGAVTMAKINQAAATSGQVIKWNGSAWSPADDDNNAAAISTINTQLTQLNNTVSQNYQDLSTANAVQDSAIQQIQSVNNQQNTTITNLQNTVSQNYQTVTNVNDTQTQQIAAIVTVNTQQNTSITNLQNTVTQNYNTLNNAIQNPTVTNTINGNSFTTSVNGTTSNAITLPTGPTGATGADGLSAYQVWLNAGNTGTQAQFLASLKGADGATGPQGPAGSNASVTGTAPIAVNSGVVSLNDAGVSTAKIADNAVTVAKLPTGATNTTFLQGDGTWANQNALNTPSTAITDTTTQVAVPSTDVQGAISDLATAIKTASNNNIYGSDGTLTGNRTVDQGTHDLNFAGTGTTFFNKTSIGSTQAFNDFSTARLVISDKDNLGNNDIVQVASNGGFPVHYFANANGTIENPTSLQDWDIVGTILFQGHDGTSYTNSSPAAGIYSLVNGTPSTGIIPGSLSFTTTSEQGLNRARMLIASNGNIGIGTNYDTPTNRLTVNGGINAFGNEAISNQGLHLQWNRELGVGESWIINQKGASSSPNAGIRFGSASQTNDITEWARFIDNGNLGIGTTAPTAQLHTTGSVLFAGAGTPGDGKVLTSDANGLATWQTLTVPTIKGIVNCDGTLTQVISDSNVTANSSILVSYEDNSGDIIYTSIKNRVAGTGFTVQFGAIPSTAAKINYIIVP